MQCCNTSYSVTVGNCRQMAAPIGLSSTGRTVIAHGVSVPFRKLVDQFSLWREVMFCSTIRAPCKVTTISIMGLQLSRTGLWVEGVMSNNPVPFNTQLVNSCKTCTHGFLSGNATRTAHTLTGIHLVIGDVISGR